MGQASISLLQRCMANQACNSLLPAGAAAWVVGQTLNDALPKADDLVPTAPTNFQIADGGKQPTHTGNNNSVPNYGNVTATPGDAIVNPGVPGIEAANPLPGGNVMPNPNNGPVAPITSGGFGEGTQPVTSPVMMSTGQNPPAQPQGSSVNGTTIALNGNTVPVITPGSLPPAAEASVVSTLNNIQAGTQPAGPQSVRWGIPFQNRDGDLPAGQYQEYRLPPSPGQSGAGTNRIVVDINTGATYLTWTHYGTAGNPPFVRIK